MPVNSAEIAANGTITLETGRLLLRKIHPGDTQNAFDNWTSRPEVFRYAAASPHSTPEETKQQILGWMEFYEKPLGYLWAIVYKENGQAIGVIDAHNMHTGHRRIEVGYTLGDAYWGKGIATEALQCVMEYLFKQENFNRISASHYVPNIASGKVLEKCGMEREGIMRDYICAKGIYYDSVLYAAINPNRKPAEADL